MISCFKKCLIWCAINWHMEDARKGLQFQIWDLHPALNGWFWAGGRGSDANMIIWVQRLTPSCQVTQLENCFRTSNSLPLLLRDWVGVREERKKRWTLDFGSDFMDSCLPKARDFEDSPCVKEVRVESLPYAWDGSGPWRDNKMDQVPNLMELPFGLGFS